MVPVATQSKKHHCGWLGGWLGGKGKKKQTNIACKICEGRGMRKDGFTLECKQDTSKVETPGTSMLAWIQSCSGQLHSENRRRASRSRTCPLMHLLKPKCQEKGLQKLLCTSDVLQMGALILYPPSFKPPPPIDTDVRGLVVIEEHLKNPKPWNLYRRCRNSKPCLQAAFLQQYATLKQNFPRFCCGKSQKLHTVIDYCTAASMHTDERERSLTTNLWLALWWMRHDGGNGILRTKSGDAAHGVASSRYILLDPCAKAKEWWCPFGPKRLESYKTRVAPHALSLPLSHATECNHPCKHTVTAS